MADTTTYNERAHQGGPQIFELLSEMEKRDVGSRKVDAPDPDPRGFDIVNDTGHKVGSVDDLYVDPHTHMPFFAVLRLGDHTLGIGDRRVLVGYSDLLITNEKQVQVRVSLP